MPNIVNQMCENKLRCVLHDELLTEHEMDRKTFTDFRDIVNKFSRILIVHPVIVKVTKYMERKQVLYARINIKHRKAFYILAATKLIRRTIRQWRFVCQYR